MELPAHRCPHTDTNAPPQDAHVIILLRNGAGGRCRLCRTIVYSLFAAVCVVSPCYADVSQEQVIDAMKRASAFMMETVAYRDGFVDKYTEDLSERWGEVPARSTMIWVQDPGTTTVGRALLAAYKATGDGLFLDYTKRVANALVAGQLPCGGWHYFIDFDPQGTQQWYDDVLSKAWGWEEFYHWGGNATFDDNTTVGATEFLLEVYLESRDLRFEAPLYKALDFILESQYPLGGWPQRYPLSHAHGFEGRPDYTPFYTFNDDVIAGNIELLLRAHAELGDTRFEEAALRGMYFTALAQQGEPQAGWAQQYSMDLKPAQARSYEPAGLGPSQTVQCIHSLLGYYKRTGDRRFLRGIPEALTWLDVARLPDGHSDAGHTHAQFVEVGTDKPLYAHRRGTSIEDGAYWVDYVPEDFPGHYGMQVTLDVDAIRNEFERVSALSPEEAHAEHVAQGEDVPAATAPNPKAIQQLLDGMDPRGAWVEDLEVVDYTDWKFKPRRTFRGISVRTFARNLEAMAAHSTFSRGN